MPVTPTPAHPMVEIALEKRLVGDVWALVDVDGNVTLVDKYPMHQVEENYIHLSPQGARALRNPLNSPLAVNLIRQS